MLKSYPGFYVFSTKVNTRLKTLFYKWMETTNKTTFEWKWLVNDLDDIKNT